MPGFRFWKIKNQDVDYFYKVISMGHPPCCLIKESGAEFQCNKKYFREKHWLVSQNMSHHAEIKNWIIFKSPRDPFENTLCSDWNWNAGWLMSSLTTSLSSLLLRKMKNALFFHMLFTVKVDETSRLRGEGRGAIEREFWCLLRNDDFHQKNSPKWLEVKIILLHLAFLFPQLAKWEQTEKILG